MNILDQIETLKHNFWRDRGECPDKLYISPTPYRELMAAIYSNHFWLMFNDKGVKEYSGMKIIKVYDKDHLNVAL